MAGRHNRTEDAIHPPFENGGLFAARSIKAGVLVDVGFGEYKYALSVSASKGLKLQFQE